MNLLKYRLSRSAILNLLLVAFLILLLVNPGAKATLIEGLMKLGFYNPDVPSTETAMALKPGSEGVSFRDGDGKVVSLNSLKGKVVFINFWATWCPPCRAEMPSINKVFKK
ncbi:MAG TPA: TlpA disulfide reductase family protein, partial [Flavitalea sp.]|nr:TlpA disulfide reductase family protein [Flavitalea sp.]